MTYYPDLAPYDYLPDTVPQGVELLTVGWLEPGHDFPTATAAEDAIPPMLPPLTGPKPPLTPATPNPDPIFWQNLVTLAADHPSPPPAASTAAASATSSRPTTSSAPSTAPASSTSAAPRSASSPPTAAG